MDISLFRSIAGQYGELCRTQSVEIMNVISHQIEDQIIQHRLAVDFYAGFQRFSHFPDQLRRYSRLGTVCRRVYIFGIPDHQPPKIPGIEFIELSATSALAKEWFLFVNTSDFWATLIAQEIESHGSSDGRKFDCLWSYDEVVIDRIGLLMSQIMETMYEPTTQRSYGKQNIHIAEINSRLLNLIQHSETASQRRWQQLRTLHEIASITLSSPMQLLQDVATILNSIFGAAGVAIAFKANNKLYTVPVMEGEANRRHWKLPLSEGLSGHAMLQNRLIHIRDTIQRGEVEMLLPSTRSLLAAPIVSNHTYGAIVVGALEADAWDVEDGKTLTTIARTVALYLDHFLVQQHDNGHRTVAQTSNSC